MAENMVKVIHWKWDVACDNYTLGLNESCACYMYKKKS